jgi:hypothetical protein
MKKLLLALALASGALGACGPSAAEVKTAQTAHYRTSGNELYSIAMQTASADYKIGEQDPTELRFATAPQWYSPEGGRQSAGAGGYAQVDDRSVNLSLVVSVVDADMGTWSISIEPDVEQFISGSPQPRHLAPDDPNMPPWVHGRVESLQVAIYKAAQRYAEPTQ